MLGGEWAGAGHDGNQKTREDTVALSLRTDTDGSDQGDRCEGGGFWIYFKVGVMGFVVR